MILFTGIFKNACSAVVYHFVVGRESDGHVRVARHRRAPQFKFVAKALDGVSYQSRARTRLDAIVEQTETSFRVTTTLIN